MCPQEERVVATTALLLVVIKNEVKCIPASIQCRHLVISNGLY